MFDISQLTSFLGWCALLNLIFLGLATFALIAMRGFILPIHERILGIPQEELLLLYIQYIAQYKIAFIIFSLIPYLALRIMAP